LQKGLYGVAHFFAIALVLSVHGCVRDATRVIETRAHALPANHIPKPTPASLAVHPTVAVKTFARRPSSDVSIQSTDFIF
jgi:hypothetical protein